VSPTHRVIQEGDKDMHWSVGKKHAFKRRYSEFLGLPLVADAYHALCFAIAYAEHGKPMRTG